MNEIWQSMTFQSQVLVMQTVPGVDVNKLAEPVQKSLPSIFSAILILLVGWIVALIAGWIASSILSKTNLDNQLLSNFAGSSTVGGLKPEKLVSTIVFWVIFLFGVVAFLNALNLTGVSAPVQNLLDQVLGFLPKLFSAAVLIAIAWIVATAVKMLILRVSQSFGIDRKLQINSSTSSANAMVPSATIANLSFWLILLFFLSPILETIGLSSSLAPVQNLSGEIISAIPKIFKAGIIGLVSWFVAKIVRDIVTNLATAAGSERLGANLGLNRPLVQTSRTSSGQTGVPSPPRPPSAGFSLANIVGTIVYVMILVPGIISALQALDIPAISGPAVNMLNEVTLMLPRILTAGALIAISYFVGRFLSELVASTLAALGFNNIVRALGLTSLVDEAVPNQTQIQAKTPAEIAGIVTLVATMLLAVVTAMDILKIPALTNITQSILVIAGQILTGLVVVAIGLFLANLAYRLINAAGNRQAAILAQAARIVIIVLVSAMGLQRMGIAPDIVNLAFGLSLGAIAIASAIAFGLGGRDVAGEQLREWLTSYKR
jgi:Conserved TM helix